jgi:hypothetical protein
MNIYNMNIYFLVLLALVNYFECCVPVVLKNNMFSATGLFPLGWWAMPKSPGLLGYAPVVTK